MYDNDDATQNDSGVSTGTCPNGHKITAIERRGLSGEVYAQPCGCSITELAARNFPNGGDGAAVATDGGQTMDATRSLRSRLLDQIHELDDDDEVSGASIGDVTEWALANTDANIKQVGDCLRRLMLSGDAYQPNETTIRLVDPTILESADDDRALPDGSGQCGVHDCTNNATHAVSTEPAGKKARCFKHALEEVEGIGSAKSGRLAREFDSLHDLCEPLKNGSSVRLARLDGFSPDSAAELKDRLQDAGLWKVPATDGGVDLAEWHSLTGFQRDLLMGVRAVEASSEETYGLAVKRQLEEWYDKELNHGRLYPNLDELVNKGLLEKSELDQRTNSYQLSSHGRGLLDFALATFADLLHSPEEAPSPKPVRADGGTPGGED